MSLVADIMDNAARADREALFAALQAAVGQISDISFGRWDLRTAEGRVMAHDAALNEVARRLRIGKPYGAPGTPEVAPPAPPVSTEDGG